MYMYYVHAQYKLVIIIVVSCLISAPFPGGCCLTCNMEFDPNIIISYDSVETNVTFSFANVYYGRCAISYFNHAIHLLLQSGHLKPWTLWVYFYLFFTYFLLFSELVNHSRDLKQRLRHFFYPFSTFLSKDNTAMVL